MVTSSTIGTYESLTIEYSKLCAVIIDAMRLYGTIVTSGTVGTKEINTPEY